MNYLDMYEKLRNTEDKVDCSLSYNTADELKYIVESCTSEEIISAISKYPTKIYADFIKLLSETYNGKNFIIGSGSEDIIWKINTLLLINKKTGVVVPNFYRIFETLHNPVFISNPIEKETGLLHLAPIRNFLENKQVEAIWLSNPNPITGQYFLREEIELLVKEFPSVLVAVDEVSMDAVSCEKEKSLLYSSENRPNLIIVRSFSKFYGIPGARLGYACMAEQYSSCITKNSPVFPVDGFSLLLARKLLGNQLFHDRVLYKIAEHRKELQKLISSSKNMRYIESSSNILAVRYLSQNINLWEKLEQNGIISFRIDNEIGVSQQNMVRITIPSEPAKFVTIYKAMEQIIADYDT